MPTTLDENMVSRPRSYVEPTTYTTLRSGEIVQVWTAVILAPRRSVECIHAHRTGPQTHHCVFTAGATGTTTSLPKTPGKMANRRETVGERAIAASCCHLNVNIVQYYIMSSALCMLRVVGPKQLRAILDLAPVFQGTLSARVAAAPRAAVSPAGL